MTNYEKMIAAIKVIMRPVLLLISIYFFSVVRDEGMKIETKEVIGDAIYS